MGQKLKRVTHAHKECMSLILVSCNITMASHTVVYHVETCVWTAKKTMGESPKAMSSSGVV